MEGREGVKGREGGREVNQRLLSLSKLKISLPIPLEVSVSENGLLKLGQTKIISMGQKTTHYSPRTENFSRPFFNGFFTTVQLPDPNSPMRSSTLLRWLRRAT